MFGAISSKVIIDMNEENLRQWIQLDEKISRLKQVLANLQKQHDELEEKILRSVSEDELPKLKVKISTGGTIRFREIQIQPSLSQTFVLSALKKYFSSSNEAETVLRFILSERVPKKKWILRKLKT